MERTRKKREQGRRKSQWDKRKKKERKNKSEKTEGREGIVRGEKRDGWKRTRIRREKKVPGI